MGTEDEMEVEVEVLEAEAEAGGKTSQLPWIEKYRPKSLSELIAHDEIINIRKPASPALPPPSAV